MDILFLMIPVSVVLVFLIGAVFWWSIRQGQFEDMEGPAYRILMDDDSVRPVAVSPESPCADDQDAGVAQAK
jgi:cbb3-type cytochrome oxidase maturation protein